MKKAAAAICALIILILALAAEAYAAEVRPVLGYIAGPEGSGNTDVYLQSVRGEYYLFLPASADLRDLRFFFDGGEASLSAGGLCRTVKSGESFDLLPLFYGEEREE